MNSFEMLKAVAASQNIPAFPDVCTTTGLTKWAVYTLETNTCDGFCDNGYTFLRDDVQLSVYLPINFNFFSTMVAIRQALTSYGFAAPIVDTVSHTDQRIRQLIFSTSRTYSAAD